jgi:hypothetical protein
MSSYFMVRLSFDFAQDKSLTIKRGHRKSAGDWSGMGTRPTMYFANQRETHRWMMSRCIGTHIHTNNIRKEQGARHK